MEYKSFFSMLGMRFARGFVAGVIGSLTMLVGASPVENLLSNPKAWVFALISGGISGACLAVDKALRADKTNMY